MWVSALPTADGGRPRRPLLCPRARVCHRPERPLGHRLGAVDGFEGQHLPLEVGGQHEQVEELRDAGAREPQLAPRAAWSATSPRSMAASRWCARASCRATFAGRRTGSGLSGGGVGVSSTLRLRRQKIGSSITR